MAYSLFLLLLMQPDPAAIRRLFEENLASAEKRYGWEDVRTLQAGRDLGLFLKNQGDRVGAQAMLIRVLRADEKSLGLTADQSLMDAAELATVSPPGDAAQLWRRVAASVRVDLAAGALAALGDLRAEAGDTGAAVDLYRRALSFAEKARGKDSPAVAVRLNALAVLLNEREGIPMLERALAIDRRVLGERHPETSTTHANLAGLLLNSGQPDRALAQANAAMAAFVETLGPEHPRVAAVSLILAACWRAKGDRVRAERLYRKALAIDERAYGPQHPETLTDVRSLAEFLREIGKTGEAVLLENRLR